MNESLEKIYFYLTNVLKQKSTFPLNNNKKNAYPNREWSSARKLIRIYSFLQNLANLNVNSTIN